MKIEYSPLMEIDYLTGSQAGTGISRKALKKRKDLGCLNIWLPKDQVESFVKLKKLEASLEGGKFRTTVEMSIEVYEKIILPYLQLKFNQD